MRIIQRIGLITLMGLALSMIARYAYGGDAVNLEYKYTPGEILRYKIVSDVKVQITSSPNGASITMPMKMACVFKQHTKRVLPDGNAEIVLSVESLRMEVMGETRELPFKQIPPITMVVSKKGEVKSIAAKELFEKIIPGGQLMCTKGMGTNMVMLPQGELRVGDTWAKDFPAVEGLNNVRLSGRLLSTDFKVGKYSTAAFKECFGGDLDVTLPMAINAQGNAGMPLGGKLKGGFLGDSIVCFSVERGQLIRTDGNLNMNITASMEGINNGSPANVAAQMEIAYQLYLLSSSKTR